MRAMLQCIHLPLLRMHAAVVFTKGWKCKRKAFGEQVDALEGMSVKVAQNDVCKRFSTKKWLRLELLSTQSLHIAMLPALTGGMVRRRHRKRFVEPQRWTRLDLLLGTRFLSSWKQFRYTIEHAR
jgi:hypothetical protein